MPHARMGPDVSVDRMMPSSTCSLGTVLPVIHDRHDENVELSP